MNLIIPPDYQRLYSAHTTLTPALWEAYRPNALATEPDVTKLYSQWCGHAAGYPGGGVSRMIQALHGGLGLATELDEFRSAINEENAIEEIGDMCWYLVQIMEGLQISSADAMYPSVPYRYNNAFAQASILATGAAVVADIKRIVFYNKLSVLPRLTDNVARMLHWFDNWDATFTMSQILEWNSYKLRELRYKNGFSNQAAVERLDKPGEQD